MKIDKIKLIMDLPSAQEISVEHYSISIFKCDFHGKVTFYICIAGVRHSVIHFYLVL